MPRTIFTILYYYILNEAHHLIDSYNGNVYCAV